MRTKLWIATSLLGLAAGTAAVVVLPGLVGRWEAKADAPQETIDRVVMVATVRLSAGSRRAPAAGDRRGAHRGRPRLSGRRQVGRARRLARRPGAGRRRGCAAGRDRPATAARGGRGGAGGGADRARQGRDELRAGGEPPVERLGEPPGLRRRDGHRRGGAGAAAPGGAHRGARAEPARLRDAARRCRRDRDRDAGGARAGSRVGPAGGADRAGRRARGGGRDPRGDGAGGRGRAGARRALVGARGLARRRAARALPGRRRRHPHLRGALRPARTRRRWSSA